MSIYKDNPNIVNGCLPPGPEFNMPMILDGVDVGEDWPQPYEYFTDRR